MTLETLVLHVNDSKHCDDRIAAAIGLAQTHNAHLVGVYVIAHPYLPAHMSVQLGPEMYEAQRQLAAKSAEAAKANFEAKTKAAGISAEWRTGEGYDPDILNQHARYADLVILGQHDPDEDALTVSDGMPEEVVLGSGRPVLIIPYAGRYETIGTRVLVAWNASREAARAVNDAMVLLSRAKEVTVMNINPETSSENSGVPGADLALHLARHGVKAEAVPTHIRDISAGDALLSRAADLQADLIVMGAYGQSRLRELIMGGVSRHMLSHMTAPVLMSH